MIIKSVRLRGRLFAAMLRGSNEDAALMILRPDYGLIDSRMGQGPVVLKHRAEIAQSNLSLQGN
jgi:hypothetical protein